MTSLLRHLRSMRMHCQVFLPSHILYLLYINDLPKNILRSVVNIYAVDITVYGCFAKYLDDKYLAADLSSDLTFTVQQVSNII